MNSPKNAENSGIQTSPTDQSLNNLLSTPANMSVATSPVESPSQASLLAQAQVFNPQVEEPLLSLTKKLLSQMTNEELTEFLQDRKLLRGSSPTLRSELSEELDILMDGPKEKRVKRAGGKTQPKRDLTEFSV